MTNVEIKVGQKWKTRAGEVVEIVQDAQDHQPFKGSNGYWYFKSGVIYEEFTSGEDLVKLLTEEYAAESLRNSILDIRSKREALRKEILQLDKQEKEAVEKLKEQGFVLYEDNVSKGPIATERKAELSAEDIEEDMTDPKNWRVGDVLEHTSKNYKHIFTCGGKYPILRKTNDGFRVGDNESDVECGFDQLGEEFKFHSRPVK